MAQKKQTIFVDLMGNIGDYVSMIRREHKTGYEDIKNLQVKLNNSIAAAANKTATAENCKQLWSELTSAFVDIQHIDCEAYIELRNAVDKIGYDIAYVCGRRGYDTNRKDNVLMKILVVDLMKDGYLSDREKRHEVADMVRRIIVSFYSRSRSIEKNYVDNNLYATDVELMETAQNLENMYLFRDAPKQTQHPFFKDAV